MWSVRVDVADRVGGESVVTTATGRSPEELPDIQHRKEYLATAERLPDYRVA